MSIESRIFWHSIESLGGRVTTFWRMRKLILLLSFINSNNSHQSGDFTITFNALTLRSLSIMSIESIIFSHSFNCRLAFLELVPWLESVFLTIAFVFLVFKDNRLCLIEFFVLVLGQFGAGRRPLPHCSLVSSFPSDLSLSLSPAEISAPFYFLFLFIYFFFLKRDLGKKKRQAALRMSTKAEVHL